MNSTHKMTRFSVEEAVELAELDEIISELGGKLLNNRKMIVMRRRFDELFEKYEQYVADRNELDAYLDKFFSQ